MATTQAEFQQVAQELKEEFADFFKPRLFTLTGDYDPITETTTKITDTVDAMREEYKQGQIDGQSIQSNDFMLLALVSDFTTITPSTNGLKVVVDGKTCTVVKAFEDAANATWVIQVRG